MQKERDSKKADAARPAYIRLKEQLLDRIAAHEWQPEGLLPSERTLCEEYNLSRMTVRQALAELEKEGLIKRVHGKGTYVQREKLTQPLLKLTSFSEDMQQRGFVTSAQILTLERIPAGKLVAEKLRIAVGDEVILLKRLRLASGEPMAIETAYLPAVRCGTIYNQLAQDKSLYHLMRTQLCIELSGAKQSIEVTGVQGWEAKLLHIEDTDLVMKIERQTFDIYKIPVEYVVSKYRADKYKLYIELF